MMVIPSPTIIKQNGWLRIRSWMRSWVEDAGPPVAPAVPLQRPSLSQLARWPETQLPQFVRESSAAMKYLHLLGELDWDNFPERPQNRAWPGPQPAPRAPFVAALIIKIDQKLAHMSDLRNYLADQPALVWLLGFPLVPSDAFSWGFDVEASLPTTGRFSRILRGLSNPALQFLLEGTVTLIAAELPPGLVALGDEISLDTKHIIAWVKENNPKAYIKEGRLDKTRQPAGDPDCKLGCKRRSNQKSDPQPAPTPAQYGIPATEAGLNVAATGAGDEYYWGYASGVVATRLVEEVEIVLAEMTQTFDRDDKSYFQPLMADTERRLGRKPRYGAFDAAFDAWYVYDYFHQAGGFAAVPFVQKGGHAPRRFDAGGLPLCDAGLGMPLKSVYTCRTSLVEHEKGRFACPLLHPQPTAPVCPINHAKWTEGGCLSTMATAPGARIRYELDRQSDAYKALYKQRTATERINSQAVALGIERPKLRNYQAIANHNTLLYVLLNLRALHRLRARLAKKAAAALPG